MIKEKSFITLAWFITKCTMLFFSFKVDLTKTFNLYIGAN